MKNLLITLSLLTSLSAMAAPTIQCAKLKRYNRPVSKDAQTLASHLNVKSCDGQRFLNAVKSYKTKIVYVAATKAQIKEFGITKNSSDSLKNLFSK